MTLHMNEGVFNGKRIISKKSIRLMHTPQWTWNGSNGDPAVGPERSWGLSVSIITGTASADMINGKSRMMGHGGDAYGLISKFYFDPDTKTGLILITNGMFNNPTKGPSSVFYDFEEAIFSAARKYIFIEQ
jgi:CubicO group peptidase (beta-lactamase class C family)